MSAQGTSVSLGAGGESCGSWLRARDDVRNSKADERTFDKQLLVVAMDTSWMQGFVLGAASGLPTSVAKEAFALIPDGSSVQAWTDKYCREHPLEMMLSAGAALSAELESRRIMNQIKK
jgi:hypothetical protein